MFFVIDHISQNNASSPKKKTCKNNGIFSEVQDPLVPERSIVVVTLLNAIIIKPSLVRLCSDSGLVYPEIILSTRSTYFIIRNMFVQETHKIPCENPPPTVTSSKAEYSFWRTRLKFADQSDAFGHRKSFIATT
jgi:hypothetical protein